MTHEMIQALQRLDALNHLLDIVLVLSFVALFVVILWFLYKKIRERENNEG